MSSPRGQRNLTQELQELQQQQQKHQQDIQQQQQQQQQLPVLLTTPPVLNGHDVPQSPTRMSNGSYKETENSVDSWIDDLDKN